VWPRTGGIRGITLMYPVFHGVVTPDGKDIRITERRQYLKHLAGLRGERIAVIVRPVGELRSRSQNAYYHGVVVRLLAREFGSTDAETHHRLKAEFGIRSTASLERPEFEEYLERVRAWALTDHGITIPLPNETT
jgi:hypothetical protein